MSSDREFDDDFGFPPTGQPAPVLAAWLTELVSEAWAGPVASFEYLRGRLLSAAFQWDSTDLAHVVLGWTEAAGHLDLQLARKRGFLPRITGKADRGIEEFRRRRAEVLQFAAAVARELGPLAAAYEAHHTGARKVLVEFDIECRALAAEVEQATAWLAELAGCMGSADPAQRHSSSWEAMAARASSFPADLKRLHAVAEAVGHICVLGKNVLGRRAALIEALKEGLEGFERVWIRRTATLASPPNSGALPVDLPVHAAVAHEELLQRLEVLNRSFHDLQVEESDMQRRLTGLRDLLQAA